MDAIHDNINVLKKGDSYFFYYHDYISNCRTLNDIDLQLSTGEKYTHGVFFDILRHNHISERYRKQFNDELVSSIKEFVKNNIVDDNVSYVIEISKMGACDVRFKLYKQC